MSVLSLRHFYDDDDYKCPSVKFMCLCFPVGVPNIRASFLQALGVAEMGAGIVGNTSSECVFNMRSNSKEFEEEKIRII